MWKSSVNKGIKNELLLRDAKYEDMYNRQHEAISRLKLENEDLITTLNALLDPTVTQVFSNESNMKHLDVIAQLHVSIKENVKLVEVNKDLTETIQVMEAVDNPCSDGTMTPDNQSEGCISDPDEIPTSCEGVEVQGTTPTTMIKRIKARTDAATRKTVDRKDVNNDPIILDDYELDYSFSEKHRPKTRCMHKVPINNRYKAVKATKESTKLRLQDRWSVDRENIMVG